MRKNRVVVLSGLVIICFSLVFSSCKEDEPPVPAQLSFAQTTMAVNEADGVIEVEIKLDKPAATDFTVTYELAGSAYDDIRADEEEVSADYEISSSYGEVEILKGEDTGIIEISLYSDDIFEEDETIQISLQDVDTDRIEITRDDEIEITVKQEDGLLVVLDWDDDDIDMDLIVRYGETVGNWDGVLTGSLYSYPEISFLPAVLDDGAFGMSYTFYDGDLSASDDDDTLRFASFFVEVIDGELDDEANWVVTEAYYLEANKNTWENVSSTQVVQTFEKNDGEYINFSGIEVPESGSRTISTDRFTKQYLRKNLMNHRYTGSEKLIKALRHR